MAATSARRKRPWVLRLAPHKLAHLSMFVYELLARRVTDLKHIKILLAKIVYVPAVMSSLCLYRKPRDTVFGPRPSGTHPYSLCRRWAFGRACPRF